MKVTIYIEGGGTGGSLGGIFRSAWADFFASAGLADRLPAIKRGGGRSQTFASFAKAVRQARPDEVLILLVDSEAPVQPGHSPWRHLQATDGWRRPPAADDNSAFLMAQAMEAWLLADRDALREYFGQGFNESRLPQRRNPEDVPKDELEPSLRQASADCPQQYAKGPVSFAILSKLDAGKVAERCRQARALFDYLKSLSL